MNNSVSDEMLLHSKVDPSSQKESLTISVIVELENVKLSETDRCQQMFDQLVSQATKLLSNESHIKNSESQELKSGPEFNGPLDLLILYDNDEINPETAKSFLDQAINTNDSIINWKLIPASGCRYYEQKNFGAKQATGDIIVFLDSDVIPEDDWFSKLLNSFSDPDIAVVGGNTYIESMNFYSKVFAATWFFPLRERDGKLMKSRRFYANNVAFRRHIFEQFPFEENPEISRGACGRLAETLQQNGIPVYLNTSAQVSHPPPNGLRHFVIRALVEGHDHRLKVLQSRTRKSGLGRSLTRFLSRSWKALNSIIRNRNRVGLRLTAIPLAASIAIIYNSFFLSGDLISRIYPALFQKKSFKI